MPTSSVRRRFLQTLRARADFAVADLLAMGSYFGVSAQAMCLRLEGLGLVPRGTWDGLASDGLRPAQMVRERGLAAPEPRRLRLPARYQALAAQAYAKGLITESRLAEMLRCSRVEARETAARLGEVVEVDDDGTTAALDLDLTRTLVAAGG
jgi:Zn-dependent peptidase ImmA (M78 family)